MVANKLIASSTSVIARTRLRRIAKLTCPRNKRWNTRCWQQAIGSQSIAYKDEFKVQPSYLLMLHAKRTATRCGISLVPRFGTENVPKIGPGFLKAICFRRFFSTSLLCTTRLPGIRSQGILYPYRKLFGKHTQASNGNQNKSN